MDVVLANEVLLVDVLVIDGINMQRYIEEEGMGVELNDIDAPKSGRTMDGKMHRSVVTSKVKLSLNFLPIPQTVSSKILKSVKKKSFYVKYLDPECGVRTCEMYAGPKHIKLKRVFFDGEVCWKGLSLNLIEM